MIIKEINISDLIPADYNPRLLTDKQAKNLKESLTKFEVVEPAVINCSKERKNIIIGGHQRIKIAQELGYKTFPCVEMNLPLEKERELNVRLNKNTGEFDFDILANEFDVEDLVDWGFDELKLGFSVEEVDLPDLPDGDKNELEKVTLIMHYTQVETFKEAWQVAKNMGEFDQELNSNGNGNAAARVAENFLKWASDRGIS